MIRRETRFENVTLQLNYQLCYSCNMQKFVRILLTKTNEDYMCGTYYKRRYAWLHVVAKYHLYASEMITQIVKLFLCSQQCGFIIIIHNFLFLRPPGHKTGS